MEHYISKTALAEKLLNRRERNKKNKLNLAAALEDNYLLSYLDTLKVIDHYEQRVQYDSIKAGIQAHAETYSFNIGSELFSQLTKEQQALWRKEIEQACISGGEVGVELARDIRYKENVEVEEVDLEKDIESYWKQCDLSWCIDAYNMTHMRSMLSDIARHFFELGMVVGNKSGMK